MTTLKTDRVQSSIPRDTGDFSCSDNDKTSSSCPYNHEGKSDQSESCSDSRNWVYPSPKMFWEAMKRKGRLPDHLKDEHSELVQKDLDWIVTIHNVVNEQCWQEIIKWEKFAQYGCASDRRSPSPTDTVKYNVKGQDLEHDSLYRPIQEEHGLRIKLQRFLGRPEDLSPRAWFKSKILGYREPFDRHDWYVKVEEDSTKLRRYIIDFYSGNRNGTGNGIGNVTPITGTAIPATFYLDVRPALDSYDSIVMRLKRSICNFKNRILSFSSTSSTK